MKRLKKIVLFVLSSFVLLFVSAVTLAYIYSDKIEAIIIEKLNAELKEPVYFDKIELSLIKKFPYASINITQVACQGTNPNSLALLHVKHVFLYFNWWEIFKDDISVEQISFENGNMHIQKDASGNWNYDIFYPDTTEQQSNSGLDIKRIIFKEVELSFKDEELQQSYIYYSINSMVKLSVHEHLNVWVDFTGNIKKAIIPNFETSKEVPFNGEALIEVAEDIKVSLQNALLNKQKINFEGVINDFYSFKWGCTGADLLSIVQMFPRDLKNFALWDNAKGVVSLNGLSTNLPNQNQLSVKYKFSKVFLKLSNEYPIHEGEFSGDFNWKDFDKNNTTVLNSIFNFNISKSNFNGNVQVKNLENPYFKGVLNGKFNLEDWMQNIPKSTMYLLTGNCSFNVDFDGLIRLNNDKEWINDLKKLKANGGVNLNNVNVQMDEKGTLFKDISGKLNFKGKNIEVQNLNGKVNSTNFEIKGFFDDYLSSLLEDSPLKIKASVFANQLIMEEFLLSPESTDQENGELKLPQYLILDLDAKLDKFSFGKFTASAITGSVSLKDNLLILNKLEAKMCDGSIELNGKLNQQNPQKISYYTQMELKKMNVKKLFYAMDNFGQDLLMDKHINGQLNSSINFIAESDNYLNINLDKIYTKANIQIQKGTLNNFAPLEELQAFLKQDFGMYFDLTNLQFNNLSNEIEIINQTIYIPEMDIASSGINLSMSGTHTFNHDINYLFKIRSSEIAKARNKNEIDKKYGVIYDDGKSLILPLKMYGNIDDPKFSYDVKTTQKNIKDNIKNEKEDLKKTLEQERKTWNKAYQDSIKKQETNKKTRIEVEWEDE
jgi:hypothetical protein